MLLLLLPQGKGEDNEEVPARLHLPAEVEGVARRLRAEVPEADGDRIRR